MTYPPPQFEELADLVWALANDRLDADGASSLRLLLESDAANRRVYSELMDQFALLEWEKGGGGGRGMAGLPAIDGEEEFGVRESGFGIRDSESLPAGTAVELPSGQWPRTPNPEPPFPTLPTTHYPLPTTYFSVGSWAFSCMVSAVILGVAMLGAWAYKITHHQHIAEAPSQSVPSDVRPEMVFVGRITGMLDVKWSDDPRFLPPLSSRAYVPLGRKYILDSGLMEITYDSGAKVILEGPCTYEVESTAGGYLALGKLTAKVETRGEGRGARGEDVPHSPLSPLPSPLFSVRTPTAVVTDLGTEFAVEIREDGLSEFRVFQGVVEVAALRDGEPVGQPRKLVEGQTARVFWDEDEDASSPGAKIVVAGRADSQGFVRALPAPVFCTHQLAQTGEFTAAKDDLINAGQPTLAKIELTSGEAKYGSGVPNLNDGDVYHGASCDLSRTTLYPSDGAVVTVMFNTVLHPRGYDIKSIVSLTGSWGKVGSGWQDRSSQKFDVAYSTVDNLDVFIPLRCDKGATVNRVAHAWRELQATLACRAKDATIAGGVAKLRFVFHNTASTHPESLYREIDVFGSPTKDYDAKAHKNNLITPRRETSGREVM